nr:MAG TPA: hypothetical protein [Caudoviricetes sp.]
MSFRCRLQLWLHFRNQEKSGYSDWHRILQRSYHRNTS